MQETVMCDNCRSVVILYFYYDTNRFEGVCPGCGSTVDEDGNKVEEIIDEEYEKYYEECE